MPNGVHVALVGLPGAGKTTVARLVGSALDRPVVDLDREIERREGRTISQIFAESGEEHFRGLEARVTAELSQAPPVVISPGGGWATRAETVALVRNRTKLVWLRVSPATALRRMAGNPRERPLLMKGDPEAILARLDAEREPFYAASDAVINTEVLTLQEVVVQVAQLASFWGGGVG